jgi:nitroreductase
MAIAKTLASKRAMNRSPETINLLLTRRSLLAAKLVEPGPTQEELQTILCCGARVPDHKGVNPWRIQVADRATQDTFHSQLPSLHSGNSASLKKTLSKEAKTAPLLLIVSSQTTSDRAPRIEQLHSGAAVCQNIIIAAAAFGYRSQWLTEWFAYNDKVKTLLGIPTTEDIIGFLYIGSESEIPKERPRPDLSQIVSKLQLP